MRSIIRVLIAEKRILLKHSQIGKWGAVSLSRTVVVVSGEVLSVDEEVVVLVELPELAVDDVEVLVAEEVGDLVDVLLLLEQPEDGQEVGLA